MQMTQHLANKSLQSSSSRKTFVPITASLFRIPGALELERSDCSHTGHGGSQPISLTLAARNHVNHAAAARCNLI